MKTKINLQKSLVLLFLLFSGMHASKAVGINVSASGKISGRICYAHSKSPAEFVSVTLFLAADSSMVVGTITNLNGTFSFSMLDSGEYFLEISETGFEKKRIDDVRIQKTNPKVILDEVKLEHLRSTKKRQLKITGKQ